MVFIILTVRQQSIFQHFKEMLTSSLIVIRFQKPDVGAGIFACDF
jgi:hypothetical protein